MNNNINNKTDLLISARRPDLIIIKKKKKKKRVHAKLWTLLCRLTAGPCKGIEKTMEHAGDNYTNYDWYFS